MTDFRQLPSSNLGISRNTAPGLPAGRVYLEMPLQQPAPGDSDSGFPAYWKAATRRKSLLLALGVLGAISGFLLESARTPLYRSLATVEVLNFNSGFLNMGDISPTSTVSGVDYDVHTHARLIKANSVFDRAVDRLAKAGEPVAENRTNTVYAQGFSPGRRATATEIRSKVRDLEVRASDNVRVLEIVCDATDSRLAAAFANTVASEYIEMTLEARWNATNQTAQWLSGELTALKSKLEKSEQELRAYASASGLLFAGKDSVAEERLRQVQEEWSRAQADLVAKRARYEMAVSSPADSLSEVRDNESVREYEMKLAEHRRELAELSSTFTPEHYKVKRTEAQIAALQAASNRERSSVVSRVDNDYKGAVRREKLLAEAYRRQAGLVSNLAVKSIHYDVLKREVESNRQVYDALLQRVKEAGVASALRASNVRLVDRARPPLQPYRPKPAQASAVGLVMGLMGGALLAFVLERSHRHIREPGEAAEHLQLPELGVIISGTAEPLSEEGGGFLNGKLQKLIPWNHSRRENGNDPRRPNAPIELATWHRSRSLFAESFRTALASIMFSDRHCRVLVFASPVAGDGKTTMVSNLGVALAALRHTVLVIDGDLRKPKLHDVFGVPNQPGLADILRDSRPVEELEPHEVALATGREGLYVTPAGSSEADFDLLYSPRMGELMNRYRRDFAFVLIDTPAMMHIADARIFGRLADGVILICRANHTSRDAALVARQRLAQDGIPLLGIILNDWEPNSAYGYYDAKSYSAYHG